MEGFVSHWAFVSRNGGVCVSLGGFENKWRGLKVIGRF